jgi:glycosyltransferase 2 family protein
VTFVSQLVRNPLAIVIIIMIMYVGFAFYLDIGKFSKGLINIRYWIVPLILIPETVHIFFLGLRFHRYLHALGINISIKKSVLIYITGLSLTVTPANAGQVIKSQLLKNRLGYPISMTSPIILAEKWSELTAILIILIAFASVNSFFASNVIIVIGTAIALVFFGVMRNAVLFTQVKRVLLRFSRLRKLEESIENSRTASKTLFSRKMVLEGFLFTVPAKILEGVSVFFAFQALGIKIDFISCTQIFYTASLSGIFSFVPGGFGVTEGSMLALLIKHYGTNLALLASAVILSRIITIWYSTVLGLIFSQFFVKKIKIGSSNT